MAKQGQKLLRVGAAAHELGLHPMTVRRWIKAGRIGVVQVGREVRIPRSEIERLVGSIEGRLVVLYGRVSGHRQKDDLEAQLERLQAWAKTERKGQETLVLSDIGSGLKAGRRHLQRLLKLVCEDKVAEVVITYEVRLPDEAQADALRLLDASREVENLALTLLWPHLDDFHADRVGPAWKQVGTYMGSPQYHGDRQWRCESEVVGRVLRAQAERKQAFTLVSSILTDGFIRPKTEKRPVGKNRAAIREAITTLQKSLEEDETSFVALQNVVEQACNYFFQHDRFPTTYEELQPVPLLKVGMLTYAGDDGGTKGQAYRLALDVEAGVARFRFRYPDEAGVWHWRKVDTIIPLPAIAREHLTHGEMMAPTLREERRVNGERFALLDFIIEVEKTELPAWENVERA